jgi:hypothetical protein
MAVREVTITKLQQLPDSLLQEIDDFIDFTADIASVWYIENGHNAIK